MRKEPRTIEEAFSVDADTCIFDAENIGNRKKYLEQNPVHKRNIWFYRDTETLKAKWRDASPKERDFCWKITPDFPLNDNDSNKFEWDNGQRKPANTKLGVIGIDGYSNSQGGQKWGSRASGWFGLRAPNGKKRMVGHIYGRPKEKSTLHEQIMLCAEYLGVICYYEHNSDDYYNYFKERGRLNYLGLYPKILIDPIKIENAERHRGVPTTPYSLTRQTDLGITYFLIDCDQIDYPELLIDADITVSFLITNACLDEPTPKKASPGFPLVTVYQNN
jgi:hypothetical protein